MLYLVTSRTGGRRWLGIALTAWLSTIAIAVAQDVTSSTQPDPTGEWLVAKKIARIKIADCGGRMWGVVQWEAKPGIDSKNPDPTLRNRPTLGMPILLGMARSNVNQWDGEIYNSEDGHTYSANISMLNPHMMRVQGCVLFGFICGGENWTRVESQDNLDHAQARVVPPTPGRTRSMPPASGNNHGSAAGNRAEASDDLCLRLFGPSRLPHERRLK